MLKTNRNSPVPAGGFAHIILSTMLVLIWAVLLAAVTYAIWVGEQLKAIRRELKELQEKIDKKQ